MNDMYVVRCAKGIIVLQIEPVRNYSRAYALNAHCLSGELR